MAAFFTAAGLSGPVLWLALAVAVLLLLSVALLAWMGAQRREAFVGRLPEAWRSGPRVALVVLAGVGLAGVGTFDEVAENWQQASALEALDRSVNAALGLLPAGVVAVLRAVTHLGDVATVSVVTLVGLALLWRWSTRWHAYALALAMGGGTVWMVLLKASFARVRPVNVYGAPGFSFPSGHATGSMLLYGFLAWFVATRTWNAAWRVPLAVLLALVPLAVGLSRIGLSVHWVSDVLGGWVLGLSWLVVSLVAVHAQASRRSRAPMEDGAAAPAPTENLSGSRT